MSLSQEIWVKNGAEQIITLWYSNDSTHDYGLMAEISDYGPFD